MISSFHLFYKKINNFRLLSISMGVWEYILLFYSKKIIYII